MLSFISQKKKKKKKEKHYGEDGDLQKFMRLPNSSKLPLSLGSLTIKKKKKKFIYIFCDHGFRDSQSGHQRRRFRDSRGVRLPILLGRCFLSLFVPVGPLELPSPLGPAPY